jgi:hypothetical protein
MHRSARSRALNRTCLRGKAMRFVAGAAARAWTLWLAWREHRRTRRIPPIPDNLRQDVGLSPLPRKFQDWWRREDHTDPS